MWTDFRVCAFEQEIFDNFIAIAVLSLLLPKCAVIVVVVLFLYFTRRRYCSVWRIKKRCTAHSYKSIVSCTELNIRQNAMWWQTSMAIYRTKTTRVAHDAPNITRSQPNNHHEPNTTQIKLMNGNYFDSECTALDMCRWFLAFYVKYVYLTTLLKWNNMTCNMFVCYATECILFQRLTFLSVIALRIFVLSASCLLHWVQFTYPFSSIRLTGVHSIMSTPCIFQRNHRWTYITNNKQIEAKYIVFVTLIAIS